MQLGVDGVFVGSGIFKSEEEHIVFRVQGVEFRVQGLELGFRV